MRATEVEDGEIDWNLDTFYVFNFIRAQSKPCPEPTHINNQKVIIWELNQYDYKNYEGRIYGKLFLVLRRANCGHFNLWWRYRNLRCEVEENVANKFSFDTSNASQKIRSEN